MATRENIVVGYLRVSTAKQEVDSQKSGIVAYAEKHGITIDKWVEEKVSGVIKVNKRKLGGIVPNLRKGDTLICSEISRLGRSVSIITCLIESLINRGIKIICVKQGLVLGNEGTSPTDSMMTKAFVCLFGLFSELERDIIRQRCVEGIRRKIAEGYDWGIRNRGKRFAHKLDPHKEEVISMYNQGYSTYTIATKFKVCSDTVGDFLTEMGVPKRKIGFKTHETMQMRREMLATLN